MPIDQSFAGKVAIVTGGASGIGEACALTLARGGAWVAVADTNAELGTRVVAAIRELNGEAVFLAVDVARAESVQKMVDDTIAAFGRLDIAVNNAGISGESNLCGDYSPEGWNRVIDINLNGVFYCMRYQIPYILQAGGGSIINMSSILGRVGFAGAPAYVAAKHGVIGLSKAAALEYGKQALRVNTVSPGFIATPLVENALDEQTKEQIVARHAVGRMGESQEVADLVAFLCSDQAKFITGADYLIDGGFTAQ